METSTKVLLAGLAATVGLALYSKQSNGSYNPLTLLSTGKALPAKTPTPVTAAPSSSTPLLPPRSPASAPGTLGNANSPEVQAAINQVLATPTANTTPEVQAALDMLRNAPANSPEMSTALTLLDGLNTSPEASAALNLLQQQQSKPAGTGITPDGHGTGLIDDTIRNGDVVDVDMFRSGMAIPQGVPAVGLIFMNVDSLESGAPDKFLASFVSPEFRVFGQQMVNRSAIVKKA